MNPVPLPATADAAPAARTVRPPRPATRAAAVAEPLEGRLLLAAQNILVAGTGGTSGSGNVIYEYTQAGALVRQIPVPAAPADTQRLRDLTVDPAGRIHVVIGDNDLRLATYDQAAGAWSFHDSPGWSVLSLGAVDSLGGHVYAQALDTQFTGKSGVVRFDADDDYASELFRFYGGDGSQYRTVFDVTSGMDGMLYVTAYEVLVVDPATMQVVRTVPFSGEHGGAYVTADAQGNIYAVGNGSLYKMAPDGRVLDRITQTGSEIDISSDGKLLLNDAHRVQIADTDLNIVKTFGTPGNVWHGGAVFLAWNTHQPPGGGPAASVEGRHVFYNNSVYGGAVVPGKAALLPAGTATTANYTSYARGINGVIVDIQNLPDDHTPSADDFTFRTGNTANPNTWAAGPRPSSVSVVRNGGTNGADRVTLVWPDYNPRAASPAAQAVANGWLEVTVEANGNTGLTTPDVFYFGNLVGDTMNSPGTFRVDSRDAVRIRNAQLKPATVASLYDHNRDGRVTAQDQVIARANSAAALARVNAPVEASSVAAAGPADRTAQAPAAAPTPAAAKLRQRATALVSGDAPA